MRSKNKYNYKATLSTAVELGLTANEYKKILDIIERKPNFTELCIFSAMWSEHCSYKSSKKWLRKLENNAPWVICGPGENAGVVNLGEGLAAVFKMESHNHPSFIEPFQGAATGVGGILRDVFTMGARPIANVNSLRFGSPKNSKTRHLVRGVVAGIGGYGNCVGVPTVGGETTFHESFNGNILVNAMTVGVVPSDRIFYSKATGVGNPLIYVGSKTGRDGIHGATMASAEFDDTSEDKRPTVQVGDPFTEKLLLEACLELMESNMIVAIQDMGAAGLTSSSFEMASKGNLGVYIDLDAVPQREVNMAAHELMLSESQERMLIVLKAGKESDAKIIFDKWELPFSVIGRLTDTGRMVLHKNGNLEADLPIMPLVSGAPEYNRPWIKPAPPPMLDFVNNALIDTKKVLLTLMSSPDLCSKRWIWEQYDYMVRANTVYGPGGDAAVVRIHDTNKALAITADCTPRYVAADPKIGSMQAVAEAWRNLTAVGAQPLAVTDCLNFGNPERPEIMGELVQSVLGIAEACREFQFPVISGNVSLYNETNGHSIQPTPEIGAVGIIYNLDRIANISWKEGDQIVLVGKTNGHLGSTLFARYMHDSVKGAPPPVDINEELKNGNFIREQISVGRVRTCHDISDGGLLISIAEMALASGIGANLKAHDGLDKIEWWFAEDQARYVIAVENAELKNLEKIARKNLVQLSRLGKAEGKALAIDKTINISLDELRESHEHWLPNYMDSF